jgi:ABC-type lipoprotein release transport system permease subunit
MARHWNLLLSASENVARNRAPYTAAASGLIAGLSLLLSGIAMSEGLKAEALAGVESGADVYCTWDVFGRDAPIPREQAEPLRTIPGVTRTVPRIIGRVQLGGEPVILIGVPRSEIARAPLTLVGTRPGDQGEILVGSEIARLARLSPGQQLVLEGDIARVFTVAGVIAPATSYWSTRAMVCELEEAAALFGERRLYSDVCLYTRPGYGGLVAESILQMSRRYRVQTKELVRHYVLRGMRLRGGFFTALGAFTLALAVPSFAILTSLGQTARRQEIGLLKAEGWRTLDVLEMVALENVIVSVLSAALALLLSVAWVRGLGVPGLGSFFLPDRPLEGSAHVPARFLPMPLLLALAFSLAVTMPGSLLTTWRTATIPPAEVLR